MKAMAWTKANWPAPTRIHAGTTSRRFGYSQAPFDSMNLALRVGDATNCVLQNRSKLIQTLNLPNEPCWLNQTHSNKVVTVSADTGEISADGAYTIHPDVVCAVLTADCVPLLICNKQGTEIAAVHLGWRGLCGNIIDNAIQRFTDERSDLLVWIGPHIGPESYEVGDEVRDNCVKNLAKEAQITFTPSRSGHWYADLENMVRIELLKHGISEVFTSHKCTFRDTKEYYSYRRESITGRIASLIWMEYRNID